MELYRCRWQIEVFFKQIKQTLQLADFLGPSANAVRWQGVDRAAGVSVAALSGVCFSMDSQFQSPLYAVASRAVEEMGRVGSAAALWDSRGSVPILSPPGAGLSARHGMNILWDSSRWIDNENHPTRKTNPKLSTHSAGDALRFRENRRLFVPISQPVGWM
ncbi:MAG: hypothetical protein IH623_12480 [Verrucomicrobia bacterium]|nr:hypothetical protein [Verrucomicrobiota bacterium]